MMCCQLERMIYAVIKLNQYEKRETSDTNIKNKKYKRQEPAFSITSIANSTSHSCDHFRGGLFFICLSHVQPQASAIVYMSSTSKIFLFLSSLNASNISSGNQSSSSSSYTQKQKDNLLMSGQWYVQSSTLYCQD